jgi:hypothetical protein
MPGYEPFLLCDFHVHTRWSDGRLSLREVVDLYGKTGRFNAGRRLGLTTFSTQRPQTAETAE